MLKTVKIQKEDDSKKNKRSSKVVGRSSKNINQINQEEAKIEKDYIQGQEHIPEHELDENQENIPHQILKKMTKYLMRKQTKKN